jgi:hypothetical protein
MLAGGRMKELRKPAILPPLEPSNLDAIERSKKMRRPSLAKGTPDENPLGQVAVFGRSGSTLFRVPVRVNRCKVSPLLRQIFQGKDRCHRADRDAGAAVNAFHGTDIQLRLGLECRFIFPRVDAIDRADIDACRVLGSDTGLCDYVRHRDSPSRDIYSLK